MVKKPRQSLLDTAAHCLPDKRPDMFRTSLGASPAPPPPAVLARLRAEPPESSVARLTPRPVCRQVPISKPPSQRMQNPGSSVPRSGRSGPRAAPSSASGPPVGLHAGRACHSRQLKRGGCDRRAPTSFRASRSFHSTFYVKKQQEYLHGYRGG